MNIIVAGEKKEFPAELTISELIAEENIETPEYVTVSVNEEFLQKEDFSSKKLNDGDVVEFLYFMGGGEERK
ncbi:MAG: sulfur carrier protein ThiS [Synergistaceae bacterium]|nr:sulfur carrier protein ThiS [Synergistaceae bacterium]